MTISAEVPDVSNFITKNVNNLTYYTLKTNTGSLIDLEINQSTYVVTLHLKDQDGNIISTDTIDLPLENVVVSGSYDSINKKIVLTLQNGNTVDIPVGDLIAGLQSEITSSNKLASDLVDDSNSGHKFTTTSEKQTWNGKYEKPSGGIPKTDLSSNVQTSLGKADTAIQSSDLVNYATKTEVQEVSTKIVDSGENLLINNTEQAILNLDLKGNTSQSILPNGYIQVDYITGDGSSYIDTGKTLGGSFKIETKFIYNQQSNYEQPIISTWDSSYPWFNLYIASNNQLRFYAYGNHTTSNPTLTLGSINTVSYSRSSNHWIGVLNGEEVSFNATLSTTNPTTFKIFARGDNTLGSYVSIYRLKLYEDNVLTMDLIPCYRNNDNVVGMYDIVNNIFYTNSGTGNFTYGSVVPNPDNPINIDVVTGNNNIKVEGKNLFDTTKYNSTEKVTVLDNEDGVLELQGVNGWYQGVNQEFDVIPNQHYILSYNAQKIDTNAGIMVIVKEEDNITELGRNSSTGVQTISFTPTTGKINVFFRANYETSTGHTKYSNIQLELGNQSSQYTPYQGQTYPINLGNIELCKIGNYQDKIYKDNGKWYLHKEIGKVVLNGSENWDYQSQFPRFKLNISPKPLNDSYLFCSHYIKGQTADNNNVCSVASGTGFSQFLVHDERFSTKEEYNTWLSSNNVSLYYILATPTTTEITDTTLISQLESFKRAHSYNELTNVTQINANKPFILDCKTFKNVPLMTSQIINDSNYIQDSDLDSTLSGYVKKDGGSATQTVALSSGTGTTAFAVKSRSTSSYISFSNSNGWLGSYGVGTDKKPTYYNGTGYTIAYTTDIPTKTSQLTNNSNYVADASYIHTDNNYTNTDKSKVDNLQKSLVNAIPPTPNFDDMTPIASYEFDVEDTNYHPIYTLPNTGLSFTNFRATVGYRITVTGSGIEQIVDIIDEWYNPASYPLTTAINRTLSTSAATTGFRYLRAVYPTSTYINDTNYPLGQEIACYNSTARHFVVDVFRQPSDISWKSTADTSIYVNSTYNGNSSATIYSTRGWIYRSPASFVASSASSATYASGYEPATVGVGSLKTGAAAISAAHIAYLADDNLVYDISDTTKNMAPGFTKIGLITNAVAKKTAISQTYFRSATPLSSTNLGTISHDTLALGKRMFLRCTMDANGNIHSDNYIATTMGAGYTWMPIGVATSSSAGYMDTRSQHFYTLDANGKLTHIDGLEIAASS